MTITDVADPTDSQPIWQSSEPEPQPPESRMRRILFGPSDDPRWVRPALLALLGLTAVLYLWDLSASGWANSFYSAAVQAGSQSWEAFFYGSSDPANSITVDKTPASLWIMALSVRMFGLNSWSILVPQALMGVASVGLLYATIRRSMRLRQITSGAGRGFTFGFGRKSDGSVPDDSVAASYGIVGSSYGIDSQLYPDTVANDAARTVPAPKWTAPAAGLIAGLVMALTPVAVLMFKFNNPDALLVLLLIGAAYALVRACEAGSAKWMALVGVLIGFGFLTKMLQAFLVLPVFAVVYLVTAPTSLGKRIRDLFIGLGALIVSAGWWVAIVELMPADMRPYIGGSQTNSIMELVLGYNGFGRLTGNETGSVTPGGGQGGGQWGETGITRMFTPEIGGQVAWLIPAAIILGFAALWLTRRAPRTDGTRAGLLIWGGWLAATGLTFSFMGGIFHPYYTVALAPAIGAVVGMGAVLVWEKRATWFGAVTLAATTMITAIWAYTLLGRSASFLPWLAPAVLIVGVVATIAVLAMRFVPRRLLFVVALALGFVALAGPTAYAVQTAVTGHEGSIPSAGPQVAGGGFGGRGGPGGGGGFGGRGFGPGTNSQNGTGQGGTGFGPPPGFGGGTTGQGQTQGQGQGMGQGGPGGMTGGMGGGPGGAGGLLNSSTPSAELTGLLQANASQYTWVAAAIGSQNASGYQLATGDPVMPIGGFNGSDPSPTLEQFQQYISEGKIHYFIASGGMGGGMGGPGGSGQGTSSQISSWVTSNFQSTTVGGVTLYDLTKPVSQTTTSTTATNSA